MNETTLGSFRTSHLRMFQSWASNPWRSEVIVQSARMKSVERSGQPSPDGQRTPDPPWLPLHGQSHRLRKPGVAEQADHLSKETDFRHRSCTSHREVSHAPSSIPFAALLFYRKNPCGTAVLHQHSQQTKTGELTILDAHVRQALRKPRVVQPPCVILALHDENNGRVHTFQPPH